MVSLTDMGKTTIKMVDTMKEPFTVVYLTAMEDLSTQMEIITKGRSSLAGVMAVALIMPVM